MCWADNAFVEHFLNEGGHGVLVSMWVAVGFNVNWGRVWKKGNVMIVGSVGRKSMGRREN